jgi:hypothetical protein
MFKSTLAGSIVLVLVMGTILALQHRSVTALNNQNSSLQEQVKKLEEMVEQNHAPSNSPEPRSEPSQLPKEQFQELLKLRGEVGLLRKQIADNNVKSPMQLAQGKNAPVSRATQGADFFPREAWASVGYAEPEATLQTLSWAMSNGDLKTMLASVSPEEATKVTREFDGKSEAEISKQTLEITGIRVLKKELTADDEAVLTLYASGIDQLAKLKFKRFGSEWKMAGEVPK